MVFYVSRSIKYCVPGIPIYALDKKMHARDEIKDMFRQIVFHEVTQNNVRSWGKVMFFNQKYCEILSNMTSFDELI